MVLILPIIMVRGLLYILSNSVQGTPPSVSPLIKQVTRKPLVLCAKALMCSNITCVHRKVSGKGPFLCKRELSLRRCAFPCA